MESVIAPYVGAHMARSSLRLHCQKLGIDPSGAVTAEQVSALVEKLTKALHVLIGNERTHEVVREIRIAVGGGHT
jgi:hypothetical protein